MNVAYDKLGLKRPADEPAPDIAQFTDQPFWDEMTDAAIRVLVKENSPFILLVEGASVDKQSHGNHAAGSIWDVIELDKAVGAARRFAERRRAERKQEPLILVTADHDQSMTITGVSDARIAPAIENTRSNAVYPTNAQAPPAAAAGYNKSEVDGFPDYQDADGDGYPENQNNLRIAVGFRSGNHTGTSVPITAQGPGALLFTGYFDQTDIFFKIAKILTSQTASLDKLLQERDRYKIIDPNY